MTSLGCEVLGAALPHPDPSDPQTMEAGVRKRFAMKPPDADKTFLRDFSRFVRDWVRKNIPRLEPDCDQSFDSWLLRTNYPDWRKEELREVYGKLEGDIHQRKFKVVKMFMKDECYGEYKHARAINGRCDEAKCIIGPVVKLMEDVLYKHPAFIKHVPVSERPAYVAGFYRPGDRVVVTDYSSFEALFTSELMAACEQQLFKWMVSALPNRRELEKWMKETWMGTNRCENKHFVVSIPGTRMSGEMTTSLANGFSNLMMMSFVCRSLGAEAQGVVEGDDGLFYVRGRVPSEEDFARLGLIIKLAELREAAIGSFCGMIFDEDDKAIIADGMKHLVKFGWGTAQYRRSKQTKRKMLLRAKSLSLAYQYAGCPILNSLAKYGLRVTRGARVDQLIERERNVYLREVLINMPRDEKDIVFKEPTLRTRELYFEVFGVTVQDQLDIERYLDGLNTIQPLSCPAISRNLHADWQHYWYFYVKVPCTGNDPDKPLPLWAPYAGYQPGFCPKKPDGS